MSESEDQKPIDPEADQAKRFELVKAWMSRFERCVRQKSYTLAPMIFHEALVWMGVETNICSSLKQAVEEEFKSFWPSTLGFTVDMSKAKIIPEGNFLLVIAPWFAASQIQGAPQKRGRLTLILGIFTGGKVLCLHGHQSINPITRITA